jgi:phospholipid-binding lipoprotein MlaA
LNDSYPIISLLLLTWLLPGCASNPTNPADPLENFNRGVFAFNEGIDKALLKPVAESYQAVVPEPLDKGITNFFSNLNDVVVIFNDVLQLKFKQAALDMGRLVLNSTAGLLGMVDVADEVGMPKHYEDFGQTLGYWGLGSGPYLMLPFFGPSSIRDTVGKGVDIAQDPRTYYANWKGTEWRYIFFATNVLRAIDIRADLLGTERILQTAALDKYAYIRDAYLARREYLVYDGNPPKKVNETNSFDEEDLFDDLQENGNEENPSEESQEPLPSEKPDDQVTSTPINQDMPSNSDIEAIPSAD